MHALDKQGLTEDTVIAFFTDHGEWMGDHGLIEKWPSGLSDSLVHEPLILGRSILGPAAVLTASVHSVTSWTRHTSRTGVRRYDGNGRFHANNV